MLAEPSDRFTNDLLVLGYHRHMSDRSNPWSRSLLEFSSVSSQLRVQFLSSLSFPSCSIGLDLDNSCASKSFLLDSHPEKDFHVLYSTDLSLWIPADVAGYLEYETRSNHDKQWQVLVEERVEDAGGARTSCDLEIIAAIKS